MTPQERFKGHFNFLDELDEAIGVALGQYNEAEESDLEELRHLQREVGMARRTLGELCEKFAGVYREEAADEPAANAPQDHAPSEKSAANA